MTDTPTAPIYVLADPNGGYWYLMRGAWVTDSRTPPRMNEVDGPELIAGTSQFWWWSAEKVERLVRPVAPRTVILDWKLKDGIPPSDLYPETLGSLPEDDDYDTDARYLALYERRTETEEREPEVVDAPMVELVGAPPLNADQGGLTWRAQLPFELSQRTEYLHLFPGVKGALAAALNARPGVKAYDRSDWTVYVERRKPGVDSSPKARKLGLKRADIMTLTLKHPAPPSNIAAATKAEALAKYDLLLAEWEQHIDNAVPCQTCNGTGWRKP